eukprot:CAMPEP_0202865694 /NCGR_PEP_ID=MMETSP1391-20130828/6302_1 /ASSEMBLY_ACC=CAM_ASM_000867 /TAXON_ID=1034604 /ORGANISM="Chlamydomonas leiostraca, Strain SAG 11-49" /LENGTH=161 /DNA_ID=CAMNT_0049545561 /DNA_START=39 /DNA_END=524 /DNA_ORIENTATION=-
MSLSVDAKFSVSMPSVGKGNGSTCLLLTAIAACATTIVAWGGLASLQDQFYGGDLTAGTPPSITFRYYWFHCAWNTVVCAGLVYLLWTNMLAKYRGAVVGLFAVGTLLFIQGSDHFLTLRDDKLFDTGLQRDRLNTVVAGWIMTAALNALLVLGLGWVCDC